MLQGDVRRVRPRQCVALYSGTLPAGAHSTALYRDAIMFSVVGSISGPLVASSRRMSPQKGL